MVAAESASEVAGTWAFVVDVGRGTFGSSVFGSEALPGSGGVCTLAVDVGGGSSVEADGVDGKLGTPTLEPGVPDTPGKVDPCWLVIGVPDMPGEFVG